MALAVAALAVLAPLTGAEPAPPSGVAITAAGPKWGAVPSGSWTAYSVTVRNDGEADVHGEVVLVAEPEPAPKPGARPAPVTEPGTTTTTVFIIGGRAVTAPVPPTSGESGTTPRWPTYRTPVALAAGTEKTLTTMVLEAPFGYRTELRDRTGRAMATVPAPLRPAGERVAVLLLSDVPDADAALETMPQQVAPGLDVIQLRSARAFPDMALHLAGIDAVVIDDFDTATLTPRQRAALRDYVSLGGSLVVAGGAAGLRVLGSLPDGLVPLRPSGSALVSLAPLADVVSQTTAATATVVIGETPAGRTVLGAPGGPPLILESDYGSGRVVQLAYDPLAEPIFSDGSLRGPAWQLGLARGVSRWGDMVWGTTPAVVGEDQVWGPVLGTRSWPEWPRWGLAAAALYALLVAPLAFFAGRRWRVASIWTGIPLAALAMAAGSLAAAAMRPHAAETIVEVRAIGTNGTVLTTTYRGSLTLEPEKTQAVSPATAASTVFTGHPPFRPIGGQLDLLSLGWSDAPVARGAGGGDLYVRSNGFGLRLPPQRWQGRTVQTLSVDEGGPNLEADLRLVGATETSPGRVRGTVINRGSVPLRQLRAQVPEGQAHLAGTLTPGATAHVDAPIIAVSRDTRPGLLPPDPDEVVMFAAAGRAFTAPGQVAVAALTGNPTKSGTAVSRVAVAVAVTPLRGAETVAAGSGGGRLVSNSVLAGGRSVSVVDMTVPPGVRPLFVRYPVPVFFPGQPPPAARSIQVYNWSKGTWRSLPPTGRPQYAYAEASVEEDEVNQGLVRVRNEVDAQSRFSPPSQLILGSESEAGPQR